MKVMFLDRDGVINREVGYLHKIEKFEFADGIFDACKHFQSRGFKVIVVTNQSGIARGYYKERDFHKLTNWMLEQFHKEDIEILDVFFCPHGPGANCNCRKPKPGMLIDARNKYGIDMTRSWMIGDKETDIDAANAAGIDNTIFLQGGQDIDEVVSKASFILESIEQSIQLVK